MNPPDPTRTRALSVADMLRARIFDGAIAPGAHLMEITLANEFGVSRTPVRGAMARLADEGLLVYHPQRGFQVRRFDAKDVFDAFSVRATLEGMGCRILCERGLDGDAHERLGQMVEEQHVLLDGDEWSDTHARHWHDLNLDFHRYLLKLADNRWLTEAVRRACQLPIIFDSNLRPHNHDAALLLYRRDQARNALAEHRRLVEALGQQEAATAETVMREHITANRDLLVHNLRQKAGHTRALV